MFTLTLSHDGEPVFAIESASRADDALMVDMLLELMRSLPAAVSIEEMNRLLGWTNT